MYDERLHDERGQANLKLAAIYATGGKFDYPAAFVKVNYPGALEVEDLDDLVRQCILACVNSGAKIAQLIVIGHGNAGQQQIGDPDRHGDLLTLDSIAPTHFRWTTIPNKNPSLRKRVPQKVAEGPLRQKWLRLKPYFAPDAEVILGGCDISIEDAGNTGQNAEVARTLATLLHVNVVCYASIQHGTRHLFFDRETRFTPSGAKQDGIFSGAPLHFR